MHKAKIRKLKTKFINDLFSIYHSKEYHEYISKNSDYKKHIEKNNKIKYWSIHFYDLVNNDKMNSIVRKISKLDKNKFERELHYRSHKWKTLNYFRLEYDSSGSSLIGKIKFICDNYVNQATISFSQINNNEAIVEYHLNFNKIIEYSDIVNFIYENKRLFLKYNFTSFYNLDNIINDKFYNQINHILLNTFTETLQCKLAEVTCLGIGKNYTLPSTTIKNFPKALYSDDEFKNIFLGSMIKPNYENQYLIYNYTQNYGLEMELFFYGKTYNPISFSNLISGLRMDFYYFLFDKIERTELNNKMNKYFGESNQKIHSKDYKWLVNKVRTIHDNQIHRNRDHSNIRELKEWKQYRDGEEVELDFIGSKYSEKYEVIYSECLSHLKTLYSLQKENLIIKLATWTLIIAILGILATIMINIFFSPSIELLIK